MKTHLTENERSKHTYIGHAECYKSKTDRRDWLANHCEEAGFVVTCREAIPLSLSGASGVEIWDMNIYKPGNLSPAETREAKMELSRIFGDYRQEFRR